MPGSAGPQSVIASQCRFHTRWHGSGHLIVDPISSPVRQLEIIGCKAWVLSAVPTGLLPHQFPFSPILNDAFSKPHICDCLYCAFPRNHLGERGSGLGKGVQLGSHQKAFRTLGIFLLISSNTPADNCSSIDSRTKMFPPNRKTFLWCDKI